MWWRQSVTDRQTDRHTQGLSYIDIVQLSRVMAGPWCFWVKCFCSNSDKSSLQLLLVIMSCLIPSSFSKIAIFSGTTSIMMLAKSGAESYLTFSSTNKLEDASLLVKLKHLAKLAPMFFAIATFRIGSLAFIFVRRSPFNTNNPIIRNQ